MSSSSSNHASPAAVPVAAPLPKAALPVAAAAPVPPHSPLPVAAAAPAHASSVSGAKAPVAATAPRLVPPTAAPISAAAPAAKSGGGGLFGTIARLQMKMEGVASKHAPSLVSAIKEQVAAASMHSEAQELQKQKQLEIYKAADQPASAAAASSAGSSDATAESTTSPGAPVPSPAKLVRKPSANAQVMHIPGLGAVAIAAPSTAADSEKQARDAHVWKNLPKDSPAAAGAGAAGASGAEDPALALEKLAQESNLSPSAATVTPQPGAAVEKDGSELRRRKGAPNAGDSAAASSKALIPEALPVSSPTLGSSASTSGGSGSGAASTSTKMDLPLRLCLVILKKSSAEMRDRYAEYLKTKSARGEGDEPLSFSQFMFFSTIRTLPDFLFKKTELAFCMMREEGDTLVFEENFVRYAPILAPLASKLDARRLYQALQGASIAAGAALTVEQVAMEEVEMEAEALMARDTAGSTSSSSSGDEMPDLASVSAAAASSSIPSTTPPKLRAGGIGFVQFKHYVEALKKFVKKGSPDNGWPEVFSSFPELTKAGPQEQLLLVRTGVTDTTTFPPHIGRLGITTNFLLYESSFFKRKRAIRWSNITRIERNDQGFWRQKAAALSSVVSHSSDKEPASARGINIYIREDEVGASDASGSGGKVSKRAEECLTWDQPGWGQEAVVERTRTFEYMQIMLALQRLVASLPDKVVASALVQETCMSMLRMRALEAVGPGVNPLLLNPFSQENISATRTATVAASSKLSAATSSALAAVDSSSFSAGAALGSSPPPAAGSSFVASIAASINRADSIRKSKSSWLFAVLPGLQDRAKENLEEDIDPELYAGGNYKTAEELALLARAVEQPFSLKNFAYNVKLFRYEIDPLLLFFALVRRVRDWENPLLTLATVMLLLNMAYRDLLMYLPALIILINIALLATLKYYPHAVASALNAGVVKKADEAAAASSASSSAASSGPALAEDMLDGTESKEEREALLSPSDTSAAAAAAASKSKRGKDDAEEAGGLIARLKNYRDVAVRTKDYLHSVQNQVGEYNVKFMKEEHAQMKDRRVDRVRTEHTQSHRCGHVEAADVEGLYKWRSPAITQKFFLQLCAAFLVMVFIPFRFIFPIIILDFFTTKWQRSSGFERMLEEVSLPAQMPDVD